MKKLYSGMLVAVAVAGFGLSAHAKVIYHKGCAFPDAPKDSNCVEYGTDDAKGKRDCYIDVYSPGSWSTAEVSDGSQHDIGEGAPGKWEIGRAHV